MPNSEIMEKLKAHKDELIRKYHIKNIGIFGSYARNEETPESDIDIFVEYNAAPDLFALISLEMELEQDLKKKIDLVERYSIRDELKSRILNEVVFV